MNTIKEVILTGITFTLVGLGLPAQASELILQANVEPEMSWQVQGRGGLNVGTFAHQLNCNTVHEKGKRSCLSATGARKATSYLRSVRGGPKVPRASRDVVNPH